jgi:hypothetical protein
MYFKQRLRPDAPVHHLAFSLFSSIIMVNLMMMALPFFEVLYYVQVTTLFIIICIECLCMGHGSRSFTGCG